MSSKNLKQFYNKKSTKFCGYTWGKSANNFISLYATTKLLPTKANFVSIVFPLIW